MHKPIIIPYSCHIGNYDNPVMDGRVYIEGCNKFSSDRMNAKAPKILPHLYLEKHDWSIWIDANIEMKINPIELIDEAYDCIVFAHPQRNSVDEEIIATESMDSMKNRQYHSGKGGKLGKGGFIIRRNNDLVNRLNEQWWAEICRGSVRDQLSFPYTLGSISKYIDTKWTWYPYENQYFKVNNHKEYAV